MQNDIINKSDYSFSTDMPTTTIPAKSRSTLWLSLIILLLLFTVYTQYRYNVILMNEISHQITAIVEKTTDANLDAANVTPSKIGAMKNAIYNLYDYATENKLKTLGALLMATMLIYFLGSYFEWQLPHANPDVPNPQNAEVE